MKTWVKQLDDVKFGSGTYSQSYQDELLSIIFKNIGTTNETPFCVEFGFNTTTLKAGSGANTAQLIVDEKWDSLLLDGGNENPAINLHKHMLTSSNICDIFRKYNVPSEPEYVSIDVDSTDLWLFDAVAEEYKAMLFTVEYNSHFPLEKAITFPNDPDERYMLGRGYGASLKAMTMVAEKHGYSLLWVVPPLDAFFIRNDLVDDGTGEIVFPYEKWRDCTEVVCHLPLRQKEKTKVFVDYEVYVESGGDLELSRQAAFPVCEKYMLEDHGQSLGDLVQRAVSKFGRIIRNQTTSH